MGDNNTLPAEICLKILQNRFNDPKIKYIKCEITPISKDAEGYMGEHLNLDITYKQNDEIITGKFFMKRKPTKNKVQVEAADRVGVYKREIFLYDYLLKEFEKYGYDTSFAAKCYYCIPDEALIMDNLQTTDFNLLERNTVYNMDQMESLLKNIALFHAAGYAYEQTKSKELKREFKLGTEFQDTLEEVFYVQFIDQDAYCMKFWNGAMRTISTLIDLLPTDESYKRKFQTMFQNYKFGKIFIEDEGNLKKTCGHGDLWSNNMMFRTKNGFVECKLLDFQILRYFYPSFDIVLAVYCNTDKKFREKHLKKLLQYYYDSLSEILHIYGYNVTDFLSMEDLIESLVIVKADALIQVAFTNTLICMPKETLTQCVESDDGMDELMFGNYKIAAEAFQNDPKFQTILIDSLSELYDAILARQ